LNPSFIVNSYGDEPQLIILQKVVIPAQAGIQSDYNFLKTLDSRPNGFAVLLLRSAKPTDFHGNDANGLSATFYEFIIIYNLKEFHKLTDTELGLSNS
jgi:hypothetical protein